MWTSVMWRIFIHQDLIGCKPQKLRKQKFKSPASADLSYLNLFVFI